MRRGSHLGDTVLLGRNFYDLFRGFWPAMEHSPEATPDHREFSRLENAIDKVVVSDSITPDQTDPWSDTTRIVRRADAHEQIAEFKRGPGRDILVFGSRTLWNDLLAAGLVEQLHLIVGSVVPGAGTPIFGTPPAAPLQLLGTRTLDGSDNVLVRYATRRDVPEEG